MTNTPAKLAIKAALWACLAIVYAVAILGLMALLTGFSL
jgi:hypothetical protein